MEIAGLPLHPLVIHAAVAITPLAVFLAVVFAVRPRWRYLTRWPAAVAALLALGAIWAARITGNDLASTRPELGPLVRDHAARGNVLSWVVILFTIVVAVGVWGLGGQSGFTSGIGERSTKVAVFDRAVPALIIIASLAVLVYLFLTGDAGARAVWQQ
jgi:hypothetical protein